METGRGTVEKKATADGDRSPVDFSLKAWIALSPCPTTYRKAKVGAVELLLDPRHPHRSTAMNNNVMVNSAFIRCFLIFCENKNAHCRARNHVLESAMASCESV